MHNSLSPRALAWDRIDEASTLRTLNAFAVDLIAIPSIDELFWHVAQNVVGRLNFVDCVIYQANDEQTELRQVAAWGDKNPFGRSIVNPLVIPFGRGITGRVAETRKPIIVDDLVNDRTYIPDTQLARSEICVPLVFRGRVVGVIDSEHPEPHAFGEAELEILSTVAAMTGAKLELLAETQRSNRRYQDLMASHTQLTQEISNRKALEAKLFEARRLEAIGRLTGRLAHEFNNLLTVVLGNLELLEGQTEPSSRPYLQDARIAARNGARLMRDMLVFAQRTRLDPADVDLNAMVSTCCSADSSDAEAEVVLDLAGDLWTVTADWDAVERIVLNLLENAFDATAEGGQITVRTRNVTHTLLDTVDLSIDLPPGRYVRLFVADTGPGIPEDKLQQVFDPFYTTKPVGTGTGLGLAIVRGFAQQSGGAVKLSSAPGQGTTFEVWFPASDGKANRP